MVAASRSPMRAVAPASRSSGAAAPSVRACRVMRRVSTASALIVSAIALIAVASWVLPDRVADRLFALNPWPATMKVNTALALLGVALCVLAKLVFAPGSRRRSAANTLGATVVVLCTLVLLEYAVGRDIGIDNLIAADTRTTATTPGRPSIATAAAGLLLALGATGIGAGAARARRAARAAALSALLVGATAMLGYLFGAQALYRFPPFSSMAIHTAASVVLLGGAILLAQPEEGMPALLMSPLTGSQMARSLFPACLLLPVFLGMVIGRVERAGGLAPEFSDALLTMILIACLGTLVVVVAQALNRADTQRREALDRQTTLMHELDHRVKNNLAAVVALAEQTISASASLDSFRSAYFGRLRAMARAHEALARSRWSGINIADIVRLIVAPYVTAPARLQITGDDVVLPARASSSLSMTLHELTTNAVKHGALRGAGGLVEIRWSSLDDDSLLLVWRESGGPPVSQAGGSGFGLGLIRAVIPHELGGSVDLEFLQGGVSCSMRLPLFDQDPAENAVTVAAS